MLDVLRCNARLEQALVGVSVGGPQQREDQVFGMDVAMTKRICFLNCQLDDLSSSDGERHFLPRPHLDFLILPHAIQKLLAGLG